MKTRIALVLLSCLVLFACKPFGSSDDDDDDDFVGGGGGSGGGSASSTVFYAVTDTDRLIRFNLNDIKTLTLDVPVTGLQGGADPEFVAEIDISPNSGTLFGYTNQNNLYTFNKATGAVTLVGNSALNDVLGFDFNPANNNIRAVGGANNYSVNPADAMATQQADLFFAAGDANAGSVPAVADIAFHNNGNGTSTAYVIDTTLDVLAVLGGVNGTPGAQTGQLDTVGVVDDSIGSAGSVAAEISPDKVTTVAYVASVRGVDGGQSVTDLFEINLASGASNNLGTISTAADLRITGLAMERGSITGNPPPPTPPPPPPPPPPAEDSSCTIDGTALCAIPTLGEAIVSGAGGTCPDDAGLLTPLGLCAVPGIGQPLAEAICGVACPTAPPGQAPPLSLEELCAIPTLGPQIVAGAGGTCPDSDGGGGLTPISGQCLPGDPTGVFCVP